MASVEGWSAVPNWVVRESDLTGYELLTLLALMSHQNASGECWPSLSRLAQEVRCTKPTVLNALNGLREKGFVTWYKRSFEDGSPATNFYRVQLPTPVNDINRGSKGDLPGWSTTFTRVVNQVDGGSKPGLPKEEPLKKNQLRTPIEELPPTVPHDANAVVEPKTRKRHTYSDDFERFWQVYPKRVGKQAAYRRWKDATKTASVETIIAGAERYRDDPNREERYTKDPPGWLHDGRWEDDPLPSRASTGLGYRSQNQIMADMRNAHHATQQGDATRLIEGGWSA